MYELLQEGQAAPATVRPEQATAHPDLHAVHQEVQPGDWNEHQADVVVTTHSV